MNIYLDTEFTGLHKNAQLISIGMIDEQGHTFYAEFDDYDDTLITSWVIDNVISNLDFKDRKPFVRTFNEGKDVRVKGSKDYIKGPMIAWLNHYTDVQIVSDVSHYDFVLFLDMFGTAFNLPKNIAPCCHDINQDIARYYKITEKAAFDMSRETLVPQQSHQDKKHNSLYDAIIIKYIYEFLTKERS